MSVERNPTFGRLWRSSLLWSVPVSYVMCGLGFSITLTIGLIGDGYSDSISNYLSAALVGFFIWGTVIFIGTCYIVVPVTSLLIAAVRYSWRLWCQRRALESAVRGPKAE